MPKKTGSISVVINTKNSAATLARTLESVSWADELVVMDMNSSDDTRSIAQKYGARISLHPDTGYVEPARAAALELATSEWTLLIDDDEVVPPSLKEKLVGLTHTSPENLVAYQIPRKNLVFGQWVAHSGWWPDYQVRFFRTGTVIWPAQLHAQPEIKGESQALEAQEDLAFEHYNYPTVGSFLTKLERYTSVAAASTQVSVPPEAYAASVLAAFKAEFLSRLFAREGWKDTAHGSILAFLQGLSEALRVFKAILPHIDGKKIDNQQSADLLADETLLMACELKFWAYDLKAKNSTGLARVWWKLMARGSRS